MLSVAFPRVPELDDSRSSPISSATFLGLGVATLDKIEIREVKLG
jgi:hypothetical protein